MRKNKKMNIQLECTRLRAAGWDGYAVYKWKRWALYSYDVCVATGRDNVERQIKRFKCKYKC